MQGLAAGKKLTPALRAAEQMTVDEIHNLKSGTG
jgi:hypothetical protein